MRLRDMIHSKKMFEFMLILHLPILIVEIEEFDIKIWNLYKKKLLAEPSFVLQFGDYTRLWIGVAYQKSNEMPLIY